MKEIRGLRKGVLSFSLAVIMIIGTLTGIVTGTSIKAKAETATGVWSSGINYSYDTATGVLTLTGNGSTTVGSSTVVINNNGPESKINEQFSNISRIVISEGITSIGDRAFTDWWISNNLTIEIPSTVTSIGNWAFSSITRGSVSVIMNARPGNFTTFDTRAFNGSRNGEFITPYASEWKASDKCSYDSTNNTITFNDTYKGIFTLSGVTYTVTYKVINGTWSDDSTTDKTETVQSGAKPASVPTGMKAASGYTGGAWDTDPADATITEATTFTYTFTAKQAATDTKAPTAKTLTYTGSAQPLVKAGTVEGGTMYYALGSNSTTAPTDGWSTEVPTATEAGTYYVWYKVVGDANHNDVDPACVVVTIGEAAKSATTTIVAPAVEPGGMVIATMVSEGKTSLKLTWTTAEGVSGYDVFLKKCKQKGDYPLVGSVEGGSVNTYTATGLKKGVAYTAYVKAWVMQNGGKVYVLNQSPTVYAYTNKGTNKVTNPAKVKVKKAALTVKVGKSKKIKASVKGVKKGKKIIRKARKLRYISSDPSVASVNKKGKIKAKSPGTCVIYVLANNGKYKTVTVTVK